MNNSGKIDFTEFIVAATNEEKLLNMKKLENAFAYFDIDHSGYISMDEIKMFLNEKQDTNESVRKLFDKVDLNKDGKISKEEFI
jgi:calcium-dependent protein kinase